LAPLACPGQNPLSTPTYDFSGCPACFPFPGPRSNVICPSMGLGLGTGLRLPAPLGPSPAPPPHPHAQPRAVEPPPVARIALCRFPEVPPRPQKGPEAKMGHRRPVAGGAGGFCLLPPQGFHHPGPRLSKAKKRSRTASHDEGPQGLETHPRVWQPRVLRLEGWRPSRTRPAMLWRIPLRAGRHAKHRPCWTMKPVEVVIRRPPVGRSSPSPPRDHNLPPTTNPRSQVPPHKPVFSPQVLTPGTWGKKPAGEGTPVETLPTKPPQPVERERRPGPPRPERPTKSRSLRKHGVKSRPPPVPTPNPGHCVPPGRGGLGTVHAPRAPRSPPDLRRTYLPRTMPDPTSPRPAP